MTATAVPALVTNPALAALDPSTRDSLGELLLFMADSELVLGHRHSEWTGFAPSAEEDVTFSSIAQDEMGHAHLYYALCAGADDEEAVDHLALDRGPRAFRHLPLLHAPNGDWFFTTARHIYWDVFEQVVLAAMKESKLPLLPSAAQRLLNEERYHIEHAEEWLGLLSSKPKQRARLAAQLVRVANGGGNPARHGGAMAALGSAGVADHYRAALVERLEQAGWSADEVAAVAAGLDHDGARPTPPGLMALHRDLTGLRHAHIGRAW
jgi:ring-1,2-phenylacetyl-CoA epoxidase subunit PaaC